MENIQAYAFTINDQIMYGDCQHGKGLVHAIDPIIAENYAYERGAQLFVLNNENAPEVMEKAVEAGCQGLIYIGPNGSEWQPFEGYPEQENTAPSDETPSD